MRRGKGWADEEEECVLPVKGDDAVVTYVDVVTTVIDDVDDEAAGD